jgi:hypothetical protein
MKKIKNSTIVFHVGFLDLDNLNNKPIVSSSLEGNGLSVSQHPGEWTKIAKLGGSPIFRLRKDNPRFIIDSEENRERAIQWCLDSGYLIKQKKYRAYLENEDGDEEFFELDTKKEAQQESENVKTIDGYSFGEKGLNYWKLAFSSNPSNSLAADFALIFYAEKMGYDGVWWNEIFDVSRLSAPRGVIFQDKISEWKIEEVKSED